MNSESQRPGQPATAPTKVLHGIGGSPGVACAPAMVVGGRLPETPERLLPESLVVPECERLEAARERTRQQISRLRERLGARANGDETGILDAHLMMLDDDMFVAGVRRRIVEQHHNAEWAVRQTAREIVRKLTGAGDAYLAERADDLDDVASRLVRNLLGIADVLPAQWERPCIVVAENLTPSETVALPRDRVLGFALDHGSLTSHAALIARALEIPAVFGLGNVTAVAQSGQPLALDGRQGVVIVNPTEADLKRLNGVGAARQEVLRTLAGLRDEPAVTLDGRRVHVLANIENVRELGSVRDHGAEGVGLFRTEYLWLESGRPVDEAEQTAAYVTAVRELEGRPLVIRVFDLGGDKFIGAVGLRRESNPFLGLRSIRYLLRHPEVFKAQLRAILRASAGGDVRLMYPMISDVTELRVANDILESCKEEVAAEGVAIRKPLLVGAMIEIPSAALTAGLLAEHVDFFSIGTNDLTQYTLAADRINEQVVHLYQPTHPAVLRLIAMTLAAGRERGIPVAVCGEMAADPLLALLLVGMGIDDLSMAPSSVPVVKDAIRKVTLVQAQHLAAEVAAARSAAEALHLCHKLLAKVAPELLAVV